MKHKHSETIKAFADGIECECYVTTSQQWVNIIGLVAFDHYEMVRIKPEPLKEQEPQYLYVYNDINTNKTYMSPTLMWETDEWVYMGNVRVEK